MMIEFEKPWYLLLIGCILPAAVVTVRRLRIITAEYGAYAETVYLVKTLAVRAALFSCGWIVLCIAAAVPLWGTKLTATIKYGNAVIFTADISRSMTLADVPPSRLEFAKQYMTFLIDRLPEASCGLVTVKGQGVLAIPLSFNHQSLKTAVHTLSPFSATSAGSNLEHGLQTSLAAFPENRLTGKTIILCTDGDETSGSLLRIVSQLRRNTIQLIIIGFGTQEGGRISVLNEKHESVLKESRVPEALLKQCAQQVLNGSFYISAAEHGSVWKVLQAVKEGSGSGHEKVRHIQKPVRRVFEAAAAACLLFCAGMCAGGFHRAKKAS